MATGGCSAAPYARRVPPSAGWPRATCRRGGRRVPRRVQVTLLLVLVLGASACGPTPVTHAPPPVEGPVTVAFSPSTPYARALRAVTDAGFQPSFGCGGRWQPMGQRDLFAKYHRLVVYPNTFQTEDWESDLRASSDVTDVRHGVYTEFPTLDQGTPTTLGVVQTCGDRAALAGTPVVLSAGQAGAFARVTFATPLDTYDAALAAVVDLGLALVDYCYYHAPSHAPWHSMGQEDTFAASKTLVVMTMTAAASDHWQDQLEATSGVVSVEAPYTASCPSGSVPADLRCGRSMGA
jgi:hypothetical protein